jgi:hypothetical protein
VVSIEWINHAGFVIKHRNIALACDPWLDGSAFNDGWSLVAPTRFKPQDFANVTHIWFSHEHPDHFSPKNIHEVPADIRPLITVLFQKTKDAKVIKFCHQLGFKTVELESGGPYKLALDFTLWCCRHPGADMTAAADSFLLVQAGTNRLLNLNDYIPDGIAELHAIKRFCGDLTVLFTQFSYANWVGNPDEEERQIKAAREKIISLRQQIAILQPQFVIPFASYIFFSNFENVHMNTHINQIGDIYDLIRSADTTPVVLYPGGEWRVGEEHDCRPALSRYREDFQRALTAPARHTVCNVPIDKLKEEAEKFRKKMLDSHSVLILRLIPSTTIWIKDYKRAFVFNYYRGLREQPGLSQNSCDISAVSGAISHCFTAMWGADTLAVNGCFVSPAGKHRRFFSCMAPSRYFNAGIRLDLTVTAWALWRKGQAILSRALMFQNN